MIDIIEEVKQVSAWFNFIFDQIVKEIAHDTVADIKTCGRNANVIAHGNLHRDDN